MRVNITIEKERLDQLLETDICRKRDGSLGDKLKRKYIHVSSVLTPAPTNKQGRAVQKSA
jgi:hypothetical protein